MGQKYQCASCGHVLTNEEINDCMGNCPRCGRDSLVIK